MIIYVQWRHCWAWGSEHWEYIDLTFSPNETPDGLNEGLKEHFEEVSRRNEWSDKYRGIEWDIIENPPLKWVVRQIRHSKAMAVYHQGRAERLANLIIKHSVEVTGHETYLPRGSRASR